MSAPGKSIERAHLARQLAEAQALAHIGSWEWDLVTGRVTWSDEHYRIYGLEPGTALDFDTASRCVHSADRPRIQQQIRQSLQDGMPYLCEFRVVRQDGSERVVEARGRMERASSGRPLRKVGTSQDVRARSDAGAPGGSGAAVSRPRRARRGGSLSHLAGRPVRDGECLTCQDAGLRISRAIDRRARGPRETSLRVSG